MTLCSEPPAKDRGRRAKRLAYSYRDKRKSRASKRDRDEVEHFNPREQIKWMAENLSAD